MRLATAGVAFLALVSVFAGAWLRFNRLESRSITHPEMYVPGIPLPPAISEPAERRTVASVLTGTFSSDTHPPGYYLFMFPWTRLFGTSLRVIRLPSVMLGIGSIVLLYWLGLLIDRPGAGALAAALLAFSGFHVFWTQVARMFALSCFLGLLATGLLLWIVKSGRPRPWASALYTIVLLAGVSTHVFFWGVFGTHLLWTLGNSPQRRALTLISRAQLAGFALGSPLIAFAAYQSGNVVADLSRDVFHFLGDFIGFGFALPSLRSAVYSPVAAFPESAGGWVLRSLVMLGGAVLVALGVYTLWSRDSRKALLTSETEASSGLWKTGFVAAGLLGSLAIAGFVMMSSHLPRSQIHPTIRITKALLPLPLVLAAAAILLDTVWARVSAALPSTGRLTGANTLVPLLAIVPFGLLSVLGIFRPVLNQRGLILVVPYLLLTLAIGMLSLRKKTLIGLSCILAASACGSGLVAYSHGTVDPVDYTEFASALTAKIQPSDLVFVHKAWYETPIFYYLEPGRYRLVGKNFSQAASDYPRACIWVVLLYLDQPPAEMQNALQNYRVQTTIAMPQLKAILYEPMH